MSRGNGAYGLCYAVAILMRMRGQIVTKYSRSLTSVDQNIRHIEATLGCLVELGLANQGKSSTYRLNEKGEALAGALEELLRRSGHDPSQVTVGAHTCRALALLFRQVPKSPVQAKVQQGIIDSLASCGFLEWVTDQDGVRKVRASRLAEEVLGSQNIELVRRLAECVYSKMRKGQEE